MSGVGIRSIDPLLMIVLLIFSFWGSLMLLFVFTKSVLLPLGGSQQNEAVSFAVHLAKSLVFLAIVGAIFYGWFRLTKRARDSYLANDPRKQG